MYIFIDESGDLGAHGSSHFTVIALSVYDRIQLSRIIKRARQKLLGKTLKELSELKAANSSPRIRKFVLTSLNRCDCRISAVVIPKDKVQIFDSPNVFYNYVCGILFRHITLDANKVEIIVDKRHSNRILRSDFDKYVIQKIRERAEWVIPEISHVESHVMGELQVADFIAWAVNRRFSSGDSSYYDLFSSRITNQDKEILWK